MTAVSASAQSAPVYSVPTVEAASLGEYGKVPVGLFTGVPDISVPVHEMKVGSSTFPITLNYHLSSVKPNQYPGKVGLGWSLLCGGCITRTVNVIPDEKMSDRYENGYYGHHSLMDGITPERLDSLTKYCTISKDETPDYFELTPDEFSFNFFGHSGNFYLNPQGGWTIVSDEDIKVEFDPVQDFIYIDQLEGRIPNVTSWVNKNKNKRHFIRFTLVTPDGSRFTFGGLYATDFSVPYYSRATGDLVATSWYLSRIETADHRVITYNYESADCDLMVDIRYCTTSCIVTGIPSLGDSGVNVGRRGFTGYLQYPARFNSIVTPNETISFEYKPDWRYEQAYSDSNAGDALYWSAEGFVRSALHRVSFSSPCNQFHYLFPSFSRDGSDPEVRRRIASLLRASVLYGIRIDRKGTDDTTVLLEYFDGMRRKLKRVARRTGLVNIATSYLQGGGVMYPQYSIPGEQSDEDMPEYSFAYNTAKRLPNGYILPQADSWGYWNGKANDLAYYSQEITSDLASTKCETLTEIVYPTGGKTLFEYEGNDYSKRETPSHTLEDINGMSGGLRVRKITNVTNKGDIVSTKVYSYREGRSTASESSGIAKVEEPTDIIYNTNVELYEVIPQIKVLPYVEFTFTYKGPYNLSMSLHNPYGFGTSVTNFNSPDVGYSCVIEETLDKNGLSMGYVVNRFSNYGTDIHGEIHNDVLPFYTYNCNSSGHGVPYTSNSSERGRLLSRTWHRADGSEVRSEEYRYVRVNDHPMITAIQRQTIMGSSPEYICIANSAWLTHTNTYSYLLESTVVHDGLYSDSTSVSYNNSRQIVSEVMQASDGQEKKTFYTYPSDHPEQYQWMVDRNIIAPAVTIKLSSGGLERATKNTFSSHESPHGLICYQSKVETNFGSEDLSKTEYEVLSVDEWGNPTEIAKDGVHTVLLWSNDGQRLGLKAEGMTMKEYESFIAANCSSSFMSNDMVVFPYVPDLIDRDTRGRMIWNYKYDGSLHLTHVILPDGQTMIYTYDALGRLSKKALLETDKEGNTEIKTVKEYVYHYQHE